MSRATLPPPRRPDADRPLDLPKIDPDEPLPDYTLAPDPVDPAPCAMPDFTPSPRHDGWTPQRQRQFVEAIADGHNVKDAAYIVGLSPTAAYNFRRSARGAAFSLAWRAATLLARDTVAEALMVRAIEGQYDTCYRADGTEVQRHRYDNRLAVALLRRLDRQVESSTDADVHAARLVSHEFDAFLDLLGKGARAARAGLFLAERGGLTGEGAQIGDGLPDITPIANLAAADRYARTGVATAAEVAVADLDLAAMEDWDADQWRRAHAAGLLRLRAPAAEKTAQPSKLCQLAAGSSAADAVPDDDEDLVWWDEDAEAWHTIFPAPADFIGYESHDADHPDYIRELSEEEAALMGPRPDRFTEDEIAEAAVERDAFFARRAAARAAASQHDPSPPAGGVATGNGGGGSTSGAREILPLRHADACQLPLAGEDAPRQVFPTGTDRSEGAEVPDSPATTAQRHPGLDPGSSFFPTPAGKPSRAPSTPVMRLVQ